MTESTAEEHQLMISKVLHQAKVDVNEKGTEAAAATIIAFAPRSAAPEPKRPFIPIFAADHPFLFVIRDQKSGLVLFLGKVEQPATT
ncbi:MAG: serpin family protein [Pirellulales bacterium]